MTDTPRILSLTSAAALLLTLSQPGWAAEETAATSVGPASDAAAPAVETAPAAPSSEPAATAQTPAAEAPAATATPTEAAGSPAEAGQTRRADQDAERIQRYQDLRQRAAEVGVALPETPPWEAMPEMPEAPAMSPQAGAAAPNWEAMRQEREAMRERFKAMTPEERKAMRDAHWQEMRQRAAERGMEMPETPPWEAMPGMPEAPAMSPHAGATPSPWEAMRRGMAAWMDSCITGANPPDWEAMRQEREAMRERFKSMTPEERKAMREAQWQEMRQRAAERGTEMPETPPWEEAEKRYKAAQEQFDRYRKIVDEMTEEQLEAARALFGRGEASAAPMQPMAPQMPPQMPQGGYGYGPQGGYPGYGPYQWGAGAMSRNPMPYHEGGMEQAPPPPRGALPY